MVAVAACLAVSAAACGGRSVRRDDQTGSEASQDGDPQATTVESCKDSCEAAIGCGVAGITDCDQGCDQLAAVASSAGCTRVFQGFISCLAADEVCRAGVCSSEQNALSVCLLDYCDRHYGACDGI